MIRRLGLRWIVRNGRSTLKARMILTKLTPSEEMPNLIQRGVASQSDTRASRYMTMRCIIYHVPKKSRAREARDEMTTRRSSTFQLSLR